MNIPTTPHTIVSASKRTNAPALASLDTALLADRSQQQVEADQSNQHMGLTAPQTPCNCTDRDW